MFNKGGVLAVGIVCLYFQRRQCLPNVFGPISYGIISVGAIAVGRHLLMDLNLSDKPKDMSDQISECLLEEMTDKLEKEFQERRKKEILENLHKILSEKIIDKRSGEKPRGKVVDIFSQEFIQILEIEMQLKPEERDLIQQYLKSFEVYLSTQSSRNLDQGDVEKSDDSDMEIINKEEVQMISGVE